jgi:hypothetical protein
VGVLVGVSVGVLVGVSVGVLVGVSVGVLVGVSVGVLVGVSVGVLVGVSVGVLVGVSVGVLVGVSVGVLVGVSDGVGVSVTSSTLEIAPEPDPKSLAKPATATTPTTKRLNTIARACRRTGTSPLDCSEVSPMTVPKSISNRPQLLSRRDLRARTPA